MAAVKKIQKKNKEQKLRIAIVVSKFNDFITKPLLEGCLDQLSSCGVPTSDIILSWVPGAYEIPVTALKFARKKNIQAVICLGAVIKGETSHFELVAKGAAEGIMQVSLLTGKPVIFGVLATDTVDQAYKRSQPDGDNKGRDAALAALEMVNLLKSI